MALMILQTEGGLVTGNCGGSWDICVATFKDNCDRLKPRWAKLLSEIDGEIMAEQDSIKGFLDFGA